MIFCEDWMSTLSFFEGSLPSKRFSTPFAERRLLPEVRLDLRGLPPAQLRDLPARLELALHAQLVLELLVLRRRLPELLQEALHEHLGRPRVLLRVRRRAGPFLRVLRVGHVPPVVVLRVRGHG